MFVFEDLDGSTDETFMHILGIFDLEDQLRVAGV